MRWSGVSSAIAGRVPLTALVLRRTVAFGDLLRMRAFVTSTVLARDASW
jgi:hypothetical protein